MERFIHESTYLDERTSIGEGTKIWHFCHISQDSVIGAHCSLGQNVFIGKHVKIGDKVRVQNNVSTFEGVEIEDEVFCGPSMVFTNVHNPRSNVERKDEFRKTLVRKGASIGANATIICGVTIGQYAFIGAGAVVTKNVNDFEVVVGNPAVTIGWMTKRGNSIPKNFSEGEIYRCSETGEIYQLIGGNLRCAT